MVGFDYLGGPYWHYREDIREARYRALTIIAGKLAVGEHIVFSPITMGHPMHVASNGSLLGQHEFWRRFNAPFMQAARRLVVVKLPGWESSAGLADEVERFTDQHKDVIDLTCARDLLPADLWALLEEGA